MRLACDCEVEPEVKDGRLTFVVGTPCIPHWTELLKPAEDAAKRPLRAPTLERLLFAATARCRCGAGLAYVPEHVERLGLNSEAASWRCSALLLMSREELEKEPTGDAARHDGPLPFAFYEIKSERQPSANGVTTRPREAA